MSPDYNIKKLQRVQNMTARVISGQRKSDDVELTRYNLHWLPVKERVDFKVLLLTYKALNGLAPVYIRDLLNVYNPSRSLRSEVKSRLVIPKVEKKYGECFSYKAPVLWNKLPEQIKSAVSVVSFKSQLKTHLFRSAY